jgi:hypothetical protein
MFKEECILLRCGWSTCLVKWTEIEIALIRWGGGDVIHQVVRHLVDSEAKQKTQIRKENNDDKGS